MLNSNARPSALPRSLATCASLCLLAAMSLFGCPSRLPLVTLHAAGQALTVEMARTEAQRERGLMGRKGIGLREGMIFVFDKDDHLSFWMKNTPIALSIAFLSAEGKVLQIEDMEPFSEKTMRSRLSARYALEMRKGAFAEMRIAEGTIIAFPPGFPDEM